MCVLSEKEEQELQLSISNKVLETLNKYGSPIYEVDSENLNFLETPKEFYDTLLNEIRKAEERIVISSLYLGSGQLEKEFVQAIEKRVQERPNLKVIFLFDYLRGTRTEKIKQKNNGSHSTNQNSKVIEESSVSIIYPLLCKYKGQIEVYLFYTPLLSSFLSKIIPQRINEVFGVFHLKIYLFDDNIILSGANLSETYFTQRQDRYIHIKSISLSTFYYYLVYSLSSVSFTLLPSFSNDSPPPSSSIKSFSLILPNSEKVQLFGPKFQSESEKHKKINSILSECLSSKRNTEIKNYYFSHSNQKTLVSPTIQFGWANIHNDNEIISSLFDILSHNYLILSLSSPYFNLTPQYIQKIINSSSSFSILTSSPQVLFPYRTLSSLSI